MLIAALAGAVLLLGADAISLAIGGGALAAGIVATICGAPLLIAVARRVPIQASPLALRRAARARGRSRRLAPRVGLALCATAVAAALIGSLAIGELTLSPLEVIQGAFGQGDWAVVVQQLRLPRSLVAAVAGAGLGICGVLLQGATRNPLAAPEILGVTGGATVGAVGLLLFVDAGPTALAVTAFGGGVIALLAVVALSPRDLDPARVALIGVAIAAACTALVDVMLLEAGLDATKGVVFLAGTTYGEGWNELAPLLPLVAVAGTTSWLFARKLDALGTGDDLATGLGVTPVRTRLLVIVLAAVLAAGAVATVGAVGFVGLMAPHAARVFVGPGHRLTIPAAAACGAALLLVADLVGRSVLPEARELPSGLVSALIGAPFLLVLLRRH